MITSTCESRRLGWRHPVKAALLALTACLAFTTNLHAETLVFAKHGFKIDTYDYRPEGECLSIIPLKFGRTGALDSTIEISLHIAAVTSIEEVYENNKKAHPHARIEIKDNCVYKTFMVSEGDTPRLVHQKIILDNKVAYCATGIIYNPTSTHMPDDLKNTINTFNITKGATNIFNIIKDPINTFNTTKANENDYKKIKFRNIEIEEQEPSLTQETTPKLVFDMNTRSIDHKGPANVVLIGILPHDGKISMMEYINNTFKPGLISEGTKLSNESLSENAYSCDFVNEGNANTTTERGYMRVIKVNNKFYNIKGICSDDEWQGVCKLYLKDCVNSFTAIK